MRSIERRLEKLESDLGAEELSFITIIGKKAAPPEQWRAKVSTGAPGVIGRWVGSEDLNISPSTLNANKPAQKRSA
jgi:hypothetical protein